MVVVWYLLLCVVMSSTVAQVVRIHSLDIVQRMAQLAKAELLVVFDLDDTLLKSWKEALRSPHALWQNLFTPMQSNAPAIVRKIQDRGIKTIALTARMPLFASWTAYQLRRAGFDFSRTLGIGRKTIFPCTKAYCADGIIYTGAAGIAKGRALAEAMRLFGISVPIVLFIDNLYENCLAVEQSMREEYPKTTIICLYYHYL